MTGKVQPHRTTAALVLDIVKVVLGFVGGWGASIAWRNSRGRHADDDE